MTHLCQRWLQTDIPGLIPEEYEEDIQQFIPMMILARDRSIQLKFFTSGILHPTTTIHYISWG